MTAREANGTGDPVGASRRFRHRQALGAIEDDMALGALVALKSRNLVGKVALIGFDALPEALEEVKAGNLTGTIEQKPGGQSRRAVDILVAIANQGPRSS